jgi:hypothetical protein
MSRLSKRSWVILPGSKREGESRKGSQHVRLHGISLHKAIRSLLRFDRNSYFCSQRILVNLATAGELTSPGIVRFFDKNRSLVHSFQERPGSFKPVEMVGRFQNHCESLAPGGFHRWIGLEWFRLTVMGPFMNASMVRS